MEENQTNFNQEIDKNWIDLVLKNWGKFCSSCGKEKDLTKMKVLKKIGPVTQIVSTCENCGLKTMITAIPNVGLHINQIRTDLTDTFELERLTSPVTTYDYLDFYNETKDIQTVDDLIKILNK